ncbi:MAG TPA: glycosyltransferase family 4 protein [Verrucomicrobium sp.]|nr:glycosyltransferase family 4 protein [Verrucomicrobium sp.]
MRIIHLTPGTGSFHCGSCLRDNALIKALRTRGHDALMIPLYLPLVTDADEANPEQAVRVGGVSLYLQEKFPWFKHAPQWLRNFFDSEAVLRWASRFIGMTSARDLGVMTVGSLLGESGRQWSEWDQLVQWIETEGKPDVISLSNSLLIGLAPALARRVKVPLVVSLQGEDSFLDTLVEPYRTEAWELMRKNARSVTRFVAPSVFYSDVMRQRLDVPASAMAVVHNGLNFEAYGQSHVRREPEVPTIGYLARMIHGKGLTTLVDAFIHLAKNGKVPGVRLRIAGAKTPADDKYLADLRLKLHEAGLSDRVTWEENVSFEEKTRFLHEVTVFSVPATYGEAFGLYVVEAQGMGLPVVQPRHGAFPELLEITQGGVLCEPDDVEDLSRVLEHLLNDHAHRHSLSVQGRANTLEYFNATRMAEAFEEVLVSARSSEGKGKEELAGV